MAPLTVTLESTNQWRMGVSVQIAMLWSDARLAAVACRAKLPQMLSVSASDTSAQLSTREADRALLWTPSVAINTTLLSFTQAAVLDAYFEYTPEGRPWIGAATSTVSASDTSARNTSSLCAHCAEQEIGVSVGLVMGVRDFRLYPFDRHVFTIRFSLGYGTNVINCASLLNDTSTFLGALSAQGNLESLLPVSGEYVFDEKRNPAVYVRHTTLSTCDLSFCVRRDYTNVFLKVIFPTIMTVYLGLLSVYLSAKEHSGDRAALLGVSILICKINLERDNGLGTLMYSTTFDVFNLVQLAVQVIALVEGLIEHSLVCHGMQAECILLNKIWSACVVFWFYPLTTAASFCWATEQYDYMAICLSVLFVSLVAAAYDFRRRRRAERNERMQIAKRLSETPYRSDQFMTIFKTAFHAFDLDASGELDQDEVRTLLKATFGKDPDVYSEAMLTARSIAVSTGGHLSLEACEDLFTELQCKGHLDTFGQVDGDHVDGDHSCSKLINIAATNTRHLLAATSLSARRVSAGLVAAPVSLSGSKIRLRAAQARVNADVDPMQAGSSSHEVTDPINTSSSSQEAHGTDHETSPGGDASRCASSFA